MVRLIAATDEPHEGEIIDALARFGHQIVARLSSFDDVPTRILELRPGAIVVSGSPTSLTADLLRRCDELGIRVVAVMTGEAARRNVAALGLYESVEADREEFDRAVTRLNSLVQGRGLDPVATPSSRGEVIAVWGPHGAPGRTTIAISLAAELASRGYSVALVDADTHAASVAPALGLLDEAPGFAAACRLAGQKSLSVAELERVHHGYDIGEGSLRILTGITRASRWPELGSERVTATLDLCREWVDVVVVDTAASLEHDEEISSDIFAPRRNGATLAALRAADRVVAVGAADPVGISRFLRAYADLIDIVPDTRILPVINKVRATVSGLNPAGHVKSTLARFGGIEQPVVIPHDPRATDAALAAGRAIRDVAPRSHALAAVRRLIDVHLGYPDARVSRPVRAAQTALDSAPETVPDSPVETRRSRRRSVRTVS